MPDSVDSPAPLSSATPPLRTRSTTMPNGPGSAPASPSGPSASCVTLPCCPTRPCAVHTGAYSRAPGPACLPAGPEPTCWAYLLGLLAGLGDLALDLRVDAEVVERAGQDRDHDRARLGAAADRPVVVATLTGGDGADDEPDNEKTRSDTHWNSAGPICVKSTK